MEQKNEQTKKPQKRSKLRMILVILFILVFTFFTFISLKGSYLEYKELGENFEQIFFNNLQYKYTIMGINFVFLYFVIYFTNRGIKKGLKVFFEQEKKQIPRLPNKSLALVISSIVSVLISNIIFDKVILFRSNASFGIVDPLYNMDISYYMFIKPLIELIIIYFIALVIFLSIYMAVYYIIVFNMKFDGIDRKMLKVSNMMKKLTRNVRLIAIGIALITLVNTQNIVLQKFLTVNEETELIGAGFTESIIKVWGYRIFAILIVVSIFMAVRYFKRDQFKNIIKSLVIIPAYLICLFIVMIGFDLFFVHANELDKEKQYIAYNIDYTKDAYNINIEENNLDYSGTITLDETQRNQDILGNVTVVGKDIVLQTLEDKQTNTGYYTYRNANIGRYNIDGQDKLVYLAPREIANGDRTYNNKTYEYTHGYSEIVASATNTTDTGNLEYIQKNITGQDNKLNISEPRIYFGLETNETIVTNTKNKSEYDYTDEKGKEYDYSYQGKAGLVLNFWDRAVLGIKEKNLKLIFSNSISKDSKILINRNIIKRAKTAMPSLMYDNNPYTVVDSKGNIIWVLDAYTTSSSYPYSTYTTIHNNGRKEKINYIRNSIKVLINSYDGTMKFYITDRTDPIAMAYRNVYPTLFEDIDEQIPEDISNNFIYPQYLYNIQAQMITTYHNVKPDILYRSDDIWELTKYNVTQTTKSTGTILEPYYTMVKENDKTSIGLIQTYTPNKKQNILSYLVGKYEDGTSKLKLYKFSSDSNIVGPIQLDKQIEQDETISAQIKALNVSGTKITKKMIVVPIENTILYVEPIYQTMLNESDIPMLKKVVVASGSKVAIGDNLKSALESLLSQDAVNIEIENTDDIEGLIDAIIKANNNLTESSNNNDWEMMGKDIEKLQNLINSLQKVQEEEEEEKKKNNTTNNSTSSNNTVNQKNETNSSQNE